MGKNVLDSPQNGPPLRILADQFTPHMLETNFALPQYAVSAPN
jgi:hypothetical protein